MRRQLSLEKGDRPLQSCVDDCQSDGTSAFSSVLGSSAVECRTRNRESLQVFKSSLCYCFEVWHFCSLHDVPACLECLPEKSSWCRNEQVSQGVRCFERSNELDTVLCGNDTFFLCQ